MALARPRQLASGAGTIPSHDDFEPQAPPEGKELPQAPEEKTFPTSGEGHDLPGTEGDLSSPDSDLPELGGDLGAGPGPGPTEQPNTPLSLPGTFARPGTEAARGYRTPNFYTNRVQGAGSGKELRFGPGATITGGGLTPFGAKDEDEMVRQIAAFIGG